MDFGSEMLSVDHADIRQRDIGNNRCISWAKQKLNVIYLINKNINCSKVGTVFVDLLSNFRFDNYLLSRYMKDFYPKNTVVNRVRQWVFI